MDATRARRVGIAGLAFCGFLVAALVLPNPPEADQSDAAIVAYYASGGNRHKEFVSVFLFAIAIISFLVFASGLRGLLAEAVGNQSLLPDVAFASGLTFAVLVAAGWAAATAITATREFSDELEVTPDIARLIRHLGAWWLPSLGAMTASLLVAATSLAARRTRFLPAWLTWGGFVVTILLVLSLPLQFFGALIVALWVLATSLVLLARKPQRV
jgi:hypothetical protein